MKLFLVMAGLSLAGGAMAQNGAVLGSVYSAEEGGGLEPGLPFWGKAGRVVADRDNYGHVVPGHRTVIYSRWTKDNLYLLFECPYQKLWLKPNGTAERETYGLWKWDVAEAFLGSDFADIQRYKEFEVSPRGEWIDLDIDLKKPQHEDGWKWNSGFLAQARVDEGRHVWYASMRIPWKALQDKEAQRGQELRANFFRSQGPPEERREIAWRPPQQASFHAPQAFGTIRLQ